MLVAAVELGDEVSIASDRFGRCSLDSSRGVATATSRSVIGWLSFSRSPSLSVSGQTSYTADLAVPRPSDLLARLGTAWALLLSKDHGPAEGFARRRRGFLDRRMRR